MKRGIIHIILFLLVVFTIVHAAETSSSTINWLSRNSADRRYCLITGANCHLGGDGVGIWSIQGLFLSPNTTATGGIDDVNVTGTFCIGGECIADWSEVNGSSSDTNETPRVEALISRDANLTSVDCGGTDKVIGIQDNGTIICGADTIGGGGGSGKAGGGGYLYNDTDEIFFNDTFGNLTANNSITLRVDSSFLRNLLDSVYLAINYFDQFLNTTNDVLFNSVNASIFRGNVSSENVKNPATLCPGNTFMQGFPGDNLSTTQCGTPIDTNFSNGGLIIGNVTLNASILLFDGTAATPSISLNNNPSTGIYGDASGNFNIVRGGQGKLSATNLGVSILDTGSEASPGLYFDSDIDTGFYHTGANRLSMAIGGQDYFSTISSISRMVFDPDGDGISFDFLNDAQVPLLRVNGSSDEVLIDSTLTVIEGGNSSIIVNETGVFICGAC